MNSLVITGIIFFVIAIIIYWPSVKDDHKKTTQLIAFYGNLIIANVYFAANHIINILEKG